MTSLILVGAGGFGLEVAAYAEDMRRNGQATFEPKGFLDDSKPVGTMHAGLPVLGSTTMVCEPSALYVIAVGAPKGRQALANLIKGKGGALVTLVHPTAYVAPSAYLGTGCVLAPFSFAGPECRIEENALLNLYASVAHESIVGAHGVLSPYAGTHAGARLGEGVFLAAHSVVTNGVALGDGAVVAAGSVVYSDIPAGGQAFGNPARLKV